MLNWIATCFVTDPVGDVVATAVSAEQGRIIFYFAANRGRPRDQDRKNGEEFKQLLRKTILSEHESILRQLLDFVSPIIYPRLVHKVNLITGIDKTESPVQDRFNSIVDQWAQGGNVEDNTEFLSFSAKIGFSLPMDGNQCLKCVFDDIVLTPTTGSADDEKRLSRVAGLTTKASMLLKSKFFKSFDNESKNPIHHKDFIWILRLGRRLRRVACYLTQLTIFARFGFSFIKSILGQYGSREFADGGG